MIVEVYCMENSVCWQCPLR